MISSIFTDNLDFDVVQRIVESVIRRGDELADAPACEGGILGSVEVRVAKNFASLDELSGRKHKTLHSYSFATHHEVEHLWQFLQLRLHTRSHRREGECNKRRGDDKVLESQAVRQSSLQDRDQRRRAMKHTKRQPLYMYGNNNPTKSEAYH